MYLLDSRTSQISCLQMVGMNFKIHFSTTKNIFYANCLKDEIDP